MSSRNVVVLGVLLFVSAVIGAFAATDDGSFRAPVMVLYGGVLFLSLTLFFVVLPRFMRRPVQIFVAMVLGVIVGWALDGAGYEALVLDYIGIFGSAFILLLKMVVIPLAFVSITTGMATIGDVRRVGPLG